MPQSVWWTRTISPVPSRRCKAPNPRSNRIDADLIVYNAWSCSAACGNVRDEPELAGNRAAQTDRIFGDLDCCTARFLGRKRIRPNGARFPWQPAVHPTGAASQPHCVVRRSHSSILTPCQPDTLPISVRHGVSPRAVWGRVAFGDGYVFMLRWTCFKVFRMVEVTFIK